MIFGLQRLRRDTVALVSADADFDFCPKSQELSIEIKLTCFSIHRKVRRQCTR